MKIQEIETGKKEIGVRFKLADQSGGLWSFNVKKNISFGRVFAEYGKKANLSTNKIRFLYKGRVLNENDTPERIEIANGEVVEVVPSQIGG